MTVMLEMGTLPYLTCVSTFIYVITVPLPRGRLIIKQALASVQWVILDKKRPVVIGRMWGVLIVKWS